MDPVSKPFRIVNILFPLIFAAVFTACSSADLDFGTNTSANRGTAAAPAVYADTSPYLELGNPSGATIDPNNRDNFLIIRSTAAASYNNSRGTANWIAWKTTREMLGPSIPRPDFQPDPHLPKGFTRITTRDYTGTGYQRGHLVPSADRFGDRSANTETFYMTNIVPQVGELNERPWEKLESYIRRLVRSGNDAYQVAGCYGEKERLKRRVTVPTNCWKAAIFVRNGSGIKGINQKTRIIAVDMPNDRSIADDWRKYRVTIRDIEKRTGLDLFSGLSKELQDLLETRLDDR